MRKLFLCLLLCVVGGCAQKMISAENTVGTQGFVVRQYYDYVVADSTLSETKRSVRLRNARLLDAIYTEALESDSSALGLPME